MPRQQSVQSRYEFEGFELDSVRRVLRRTTGGEEIPLAAKVFDTLLYLVEHPAELIGKDVLLRAVWPGLVVDENNLSQSISALRRAFGERPGDRRFIVTVPGRGFCFVAEVIKRPASVGQPLASAGVSSNEAALSAGTEPGPNSLAVLPFDDLSRDSSLEFLCDGLAEELICALARVEGIRVASRTSSFAFRGRKIDVREIGRVLHVDAVVEGSVRGTAERVRVAIQLVDARSGFQLWSRRFDRPMSDLLALQEEIASAAAAVFSRRRAEGPSPAEVVSQSARTAPRGDPQAYRLYLQGLSIRSRLGPDHLRRAIELFEQAIVRDPKFARAYAAKAFAHFLPVSLGYPEPRALDETELAAAQALALDPTLADAHALLGNVNALRRRWCRAEECFRGAFSLDPHDDFIRRAYVVNVATATGHLQRALAEMRTATELAPAEPLCAFHLGVILALLRLDTEASRQIALAFDLGLSFAPAASGVGGYTLALIDLRAGRWRESAERFARGLAPELTAAGGSEAVHLACEAIVSGRNRDAAAAALRAMEGEAGTALFNPFARSLLIQLYTLLGALDAAFSLADRALDHLIASGMVGNIWGFLWEPELEPLRRDPRFQSLMARLGLFEYWERYGPPDGYTIRGGNLEPLDRR